MVTALLILAIGHSPDRKDEFHESLISRETGDSWNSSFRALCRSVAKMVAIE
jgi:hypothetical protein